MQARPVMRNARRNCGAFTLIETMIASSLSVIVIASVLTAYIFLMKTAARCQQYAFALSEIRVSSRKMISYIRNAQSITNLDVSGNFVEFVMPDGAISRLSYENPTHAPGMGNMLFVPDMSNPGATTNLIAKGLTKVMSQPVRNVFEQTGPNTIRIAYRVTMPFTPGQCPAEMDVGVRLRNNR